MTHQLGWCNGDRFNLVLRVPACVIDTALGAGALAGSALVVILGLRHLLRLHVASSNGHVHHWRPLVIALGLASFLLVTHVALLLIEVLTDNHSVLSHWSIHPSKAFSQTGFLLSWALIVLLLTIALCWRAFLPLWARLPLLSGLAAVYSIQAASVGLEWRAHADAVGSFAIACCQLAFIMLALLIELAQKAREPRRSSLADSLDEAVRPLLASRAPPTPSSRKTRPESTWYVALGRSVVYVWPKVPWLQVRAVVCVVLVVFTRVLNLAVPAFYGKMVDVLAGVRDHKDVYPSFASVFYPWVLLYLGARCLQGGGGVGSVGVISNLRSYLWIPISQDGERRISLEAFEHILHMDLAFHLTRKTGELIKVIDRGTGSMRVLLETVLFSIGPALIDVVAAVVFLTTKEAWMAAIVLVSICCYIPITILITEYRGALRREMNMLDNARSAKVTDAMLNFETVKYFTAEALEVGAYRRAIAAYQRAEATLLVSLNALNMIQATIMLAGVVAGMVVAVSHVACGKLTVGDTVLFLSLMAQIYAPLNYFGSYYRQIQRYMIDMENMFELLNDQPAVADAPDARPLKLRGGGLEFRNVSFGYKPERLILRDVDLMVRCHHSGILVVQIPGGSSAAFVGATGSGKTTMLRLLFRFYDPTAGAVLLDGQDLRSLTQQSLRRHVGVVPQDTVLFNDTIRYNIAYGRPDATPEVRAAHARNFKQQWHAGDVPYMQQPKEVEDAAKAAVLHESIMTRFPERYDTVVGERGLRLSGGEKQRVAFARAILKNPAVLVLDEATSALDSITEQEIQACLRGMKASRTTVTVAHRLSTVMDADAIVVMDDGQVREVGNHHELAVSGGLYARMWQRQLSSPSADDFDSLSASSVQSPRKT